MSGQFTIGQLSTTFTKRPPISSKVREYFEIFIHDNLLTKKNLIVKSKWEIRFLVSFIEEGPRYTSEHLFLGKKHRTLTNEMIKMYEILVPLILISKAANPYLKTIELIYEALTIFFTTNYKTISKEEMTELWSIVDLKYLLSLPYPAPLEEQKYSTDMVNEVGEIIDPLEKYR
jgi:hypothetical protein